MKWFKKKYIYTQPDRKIKQSVKVLKIDGLG